MENGPRPWRAGACPLLIVEPLTVNGQDLADGLAHASCRGRDRNGRCSRPRSSAEALGYAIVVLPETPGEQPPA